MSQLISNLPYGAKIKYGKYQVYTETPQSVIWVVVAKNPPVTPAYPSNTITLLTERSIDFHEYDHEEPGSSEAKRRERGNNKYSISNIDQWLNKDSAPGTWWSSTHQSDAVDGLFRSRPGFLYNFSHEEKNAIQTTTIRVPLAEYDNGGAAGYEDIARKVFLPSSGEMLSGLWPNITQAIGNIRTPYVTDQAINNSQSTSGVFPKLNVRFDMWTRSVITWSTTAVEKILVNTSSGNDQILGYDAFLGYGTRPVINIPNSLRVSDATDSDGCYTMSWNTPPSAPSSITVPTPVFGGRSLTVSWGAATDVDGNLAGYSLSRRINGGTLSVIFTTTNINIRYYSDVVPFGTNTVEYLVRAFDALNEYSAYRPSNVLTVTNNQSPVISGTDTNIGIKTNNFTHSYTVTDADGDVVSVSEQINGVTHRTFNVTLGVANTFSVSGETWLKLANGAHTLRITATDSFNNVSIRTLTFTKSVTSFSIRTTAPMESISMPSRMSITIFRTLPAEATLLVEICNNGFDTTPTWEDCTSSVVGALVHVFTNTTKTAARWGVMIRVTVNRNGGSGACYVSGIGGNFE